MPVVMMFTYSSNGLSHCKEEDTPEDHLDKGYRSVSAAGPESGERVSQLAKRTIFITGATRGIGHAIAVRAAEDGANVVIIGKTTEPHPKLPGHHPHGG